MCIATMTPAPPPQLDAPFFITMSQCTVAVLCTMQNQQYSCSAMLLGYHVAKMLLCRLQVLPLSLVFVGMIVCNNLTLKYLGIAFYNVGRSLTTVFNVVSGAEPMLGGWGAHDRAVVLRIQ